MCIHQTTIYIIFIFIYTYTHTRTILFKTVEKLRFRINIALIQTGFYTMRTQVVDGLKNLLHLMKNCSRLDTYIIQRNGCLTLWKLQICLICVNFWWTPCIKEVNSLTLSWWRCVSYINQFIELRGMLQSSLYAFIYHLLVNG